MEPDPLRPPSVFTARWFRLLLVLLVLLLIAVVGLPYILERTGPASYHSPVVLQPPKPIPSPPTRVETPSQPPPPAVEEKKPGAEAPRATAPAQPPAPSSAPPDEKLAPREARPGPAKYAVQVGAFVDAANAKRFTATLKDEKFPVQQLTVSRPGESFQVIVLGSSAAGREKIAQLGLKGVQARESFTVQPDMKLKDAVSLSERLKQEGFEVKVKTVKKSIRYHIVRLGGFADRSSAEAARAELQSKGIAGHVVPTSGQ